MTEIAFDQKGWTVTRTKDEGLTREYKVIISNNVLTERVQASLGEIASQVTLPGFRPGKAPVALIEKRYGGSVLGEVLEKITQETVQQLFVKEDIQPLSRPHVDFEPYEKEKDFIFSIKAEIFPDIELADYSTYQLDKPVIEHSDEDIDEMIRASLVKAVDSKDNEVKEDHYILGKAVAKDQEGNEVALYTGERIDFMIHLSKKKEDQRTTENSKQFIGQKIDETRVVTFNPPEEHLGEMTIEFTLNQIKDIEKPEPSDELAEKNGYKDLADWREEMKASIDARFQRDVKDLMHKDTLIQLEKTHNFDMPQSLLDQELHGLTYEALHKKGADVKPYKHEHDGHECDHHHGDDPDYLKNMYAHMQEQAKAELSADDIKVIKARAERRVKLALIISALCRKQSISVSDVEVKRAVQRMAQAYPQNAKQIEEMYMNNPRMREEVRAPMVEKKALDFIMSLAKVSDKKMSKEDFFKWAEERNKAETEL